MLKEVLFALLVVGCASGQPRFGPTSSQEFQTFDYNYCFPKFTVLIEEQEEAAEEEAEQEEEEAEEEDKDWKFDFEATPVPENDLLHFALEPPTTSIYSGFKLRNLTPGYIMNVKKQKFNRDLKLDSLVFEFFGEVTWRLRLTFQSEDGKYEWIVNSKVFAPPLYEELEDDQVRLLVDIETVSNAFIVPWTEDDITFKPLFWVDVNDPEQKGKRLIRLNMKWIVDFLNKKKPRHTSKADRNERHFYPHDTVFVIREHRYSGLPLIFDAELLNRLDAERKTLLSEIEGTQ